MKQYIILALVTLLPVFATSGLYVLDKKTVFGKLDYATKQIIYGLVFGMLAIFGTEFGIPINGAQINCRDGAVMCAGLLFGSPAGIIAGLIGGVERWVAVYWGVGAYTKVACTVSTIIAGFYSALLRKHMFDNKKPSWLLALATGFVMEIFHLTMVFITNINEPTQAIAVVHSCTLPMLIANSLAVMLATMCVTLLAKERLFQKSETVRISQTIQRWLLICLAIAFLLTTFFMVSLQSGITDSQTRVTLKTAIDDVEIAINDSASEIKDVGKLDALCTITQNRHVGENGFVVISDTSQVVMGAPKDTLEPGRTFAQNKIDVNSNLTESGLQFSALIKNEKYIGMYRKVNDYYVFAFLPESEAMRNQIIALYVNSFLEVLVFALMFALIFLLIKKVILSNMNKINESLSKITGGQLDEVVDVRTNEEFASLSDDINRTVDTLKRYIDEASKRIDAELEFARNIQASALPRKFPAYPNRKDFDIYARMDTAKEVGGDFYDFYITHSNELNFLIADVSGKGIPAAMFMMTAKTELKSLTENDCKINEVFTRGNDALCSGNDAGMFVTAWQGKLDLGTGHISFANAGHNPPLVKHKDGSFEYLRSRAGLVLAGMEGLIYKEQELSINPGDIIFLYTDGVTEATNANEELYGEDRLINALNSREFESMQELCDFVKQDVDKFVGDAPQFDDITMLALKYNGEAQEK